MVNETSSNGVSEKLSALPQCWTWANVDDLCQLIGGGTPARDNPDFFGGRIVWLTPTEIPKKTIVTISDSIEKITESGLHKSSARIIPKGSVLLTSRASIGYVAIAGCDVTTNQGISSFVCESAVFNAYFAYWLFSKKNTLEEQATGTTFKEISKTKLRKLVIPLPPLPEQYRIVTKIEELVTLLDTGLTSLKKVQAQFKRYRQAVLKSAFDGSLSQEWREAHKGEFEQASFLFERIKSENARDEKEIAKRLPLDEAGLFHIPEEWIWVQAQDVCENITNGYTPTADKLFQGSGEIPFIKVYNLTKTGAFDFTVKPTFISRITHETELRRSAVYPQDVLMNIVGPPLGKVSLVPDSHREWNINQAIVIYRTFPEYSRKLMLYALLSETIQKWLQKRGKTTAGQTNYTITMSRSLPIPLPPFNEQSWIVNEIERYFSQIDHLEKTVIKSIHQAENLRQSILKQAFEGKLVPQDPNDEPASILLERIKTENARQAAEAKKGKILQPKSTNRKERSGNWMGT